MWCGRCDKDLIECVCADVEERLESLRGNPHIDQLTVVEMPLLIIRERRAKEAAARADLEAAGDGEIEGRKLSDAQDIIAELEMGFESELYQDIYP